MMLVFIQLMIGGSLEVRGSVQRKCDRELASVRLGLYSFV